jgi:hypothetical protein
MAPLYHRLAARWVFSTSLASIASSTPGARSAARALGTPNRWPVPPACPSCDDEQLRYVAFVPARIVYEGKRADKARTMTELYDDGFHGYRADCRDCGTVAERLDACPLCESPAPLRTRPG